MATPVLSTTKLSILLGIYPILTGCYTEASGSLVFWREKEANDYTKRTGDTTEFLTKAQIVTLID